MKSKFNKSWVASKQPRKQRKYVANAPNHLKRKLMGSPLDKPLREKHGRRTIEVRTGDEVKIMRGKFNGKLGKVGKVDVKNTRIQVDGAQRAKKGGEKVETWFHPSKVKIMGLNLEDSRRMKKSKSKEVKDKTNEIKKEVKEGKEKQKVKVNKTETKK
ncbi:50S ribosomal protein L24 [archaeon]|jgi:large subunit ribosomal protein L24|nr:50S ribosomal protein L24 [archaeon]MBT3578259.1 50S ribosomal protein L24 [archaeon]MBT6819820.1 50S ribosomal protein L24 [archaeon]MBT6956604.1 50S ribosomal protein L24 [archaeon]MBT7025602.1 50S ribosomal protein L24 [archaeon]